MELRMETEKVLKTLQSGFIVIAASLNPSNQIASVYGGSCVMKALT